MTGYIHRDPARLTPERIAELEARDARHAWPGRQVPPGHAPPPPNRQQRATALEKRARFAELRQAGMSVAEAAAVVGVVAKTGGKYERERRGQVSGGA